MYALSLGVQNISETLPKPVYSLLSGLNASTVGIIALAAVQLAENAIREKLSRILVIFGACAGLCYNALWYFPVLMIAGGFLVSVWDGWLYQQLLRAKIAWNNRHGRLEEQDLTNGDPLAINDITLEENRVQRIEPMRLRRTGPSIEGLPQSTSDTTRPTQSAEAASKQHIIQLQVGALVMGVFFASFIGILVTRAQLTTPPLVLDLFANMYLAGTVIFGGGPVVIPLLRTYVVDPGWVSSRDFLIGLAIIQAFPGPNFNFAVFLGSLALQHSRFPTVFGAFLGGLGIFLPGITLAVAIQSFWRVLRKKNQLAVRGQQPVRIFSRVVMFDNDFCLYLDSLTPEPTSTKLAHCANNHFELRILASSYPFPGVCVRKRFTDALPSNAIEEGVQRSTENQTQDGWIYTLRRNDMKPFIEAGIVEDIDFHDRDVEDHAKADSLGKTFTVIQTSWFLVNIIARWATSLPVAPLELATVAYIACGVLLYAMWWYNPKDMTTPVTIYVRYDRSDIPSHLLDHTATNLHGWVHRHAQIKKQTVLSVFAQAAQWLMDVATGPVDTTYELPYDGFYKPSHGCILTAVNTFVAFLYCGIHLAG
ncbi:Chromate transporter [Penicillium italicum]|uniref:Chromate transporter n=1 Tax=Penicillium italicum TaxID=40296 RepID=A0A0A2LLF7_PENIT|nr:Chromate transporter [Penicillium italicum]